MACASITREIDRDRARYLILAWFYSVGPFRDKTDCIEPSDPVDDDMDLADAANNGGILVFVGGA